MLRAVVGASVAGEHHRPRRRLVREEPVHPKIVALEAEVAVHDEAAVWQRPDDRVARARVVIQRRLLLRVVLADHPEEHWASDLVLELEARDLANTDRAAVALSVVFDVLVTCVQ